MVDFNFDGKEWSTRSIEVEVCLYIVDVGGSRTFMNFGVGEVKHIKIRPRILIFSKIRREIIVIFYFGLEARVLGGRKGRTPHYYHIWS